MNRTAILAEFIHLKMVKFCNLQIINGLIAEFIHLKTANFDQVIAIPIRDGNERVGREQVFTKIVLLHHLFPHFK